MGKQSILPSRGRRILFENDQPFGIDLFILLLVRCGLGGNSVNPSDTIIKYQSFVFPSVIPITAIRRAFLWSRCTRLLDLKS